MEKFLSCDWGTTSFRLRLIETKSLEIIEEQTSRQGIAETFQQWKQSGKSEESRFDFYFDIIATHIAEIEKRSGNSLNNLPLVISGMASSTIGMVDLPYKNIPFSTNGKDLEIFIVEEAENFKHKVIIISGVRSEDDVMRGEETKLIGCAADNSHNHIYIFPGTHPKHIEVKNGQATDFTTYMTGEFFELLSKKSILSVSVKEGESLQGEKDLPGFANGVNESMRSNFLHSCFLVRTNNLFGKYSLEENYLYLSGLLIGTELKNMSKDRNVTIIGNDALNAQYLTALHILGLRKNSILVTSIDADKALIKGQIKVLKKILDKK